MKKARYQEIATADLQQITQSSLRVIQFIERCDTSYTHLFKDLKYLSPMLAMCTFLCGKLMACVSGQMHDHVIPSYRIKYNFDLQELQARHQAV